ncbi:bifunctional ornithine acetyltransferase/N-acetylglutamate synthase [Methanomassiliicoccaceae archaeon COG_1]|nr:bifunctional ornithine acetyltransferase/N-acetylglutamate synthase [Methanomassiliicoccaceae archaeon COG_1]
MVEIIDGGITSPQGFRCAGVHSGVKFRALDMALLYSEVPATAFKAFTSNKVKAAPVQLMMAQNSPKLSAIVINSGNANALTGRRGYEDAESMQQIVARALGLRPSEVGVMSTGLIGRFMDMHKIQYGIGRAAKELDVGRESDGRYCEAIMTTDTIKKECAARVRLGDGTLVYISMVSKGSGMISPHLKVLHGTTLSTIATDAVLTPAFNETFQRMLDNSVNMVSVDGDQSTNDTCLMLANGMAGGAAADEDPAFIEALELVLTRIARTLAMDGEGATKLITVEINGAKDDEQARRAAKTIIDSPLVKTAIFGSDPNYGRVMMALGNSGVDFKLEEVYLTIKGGDMEVPILDSGAPIFQEERSVEVVRMAMDNKEVVLQLDLGVGDGSATAWGCDLTYDYVRINAEYAT